MCLFQPLITVTLNCSLCFFLLSPYQEEYCMMDSSRVPASVHPDSFLAYLCQHTPLLNRAGQELLRTLPFRWWNAPSQRWEQTTATLGAIDNGNDALKGAMPHAHFPQIKATRIPTAYAPARIIRGGEGITTWQIGDAEAFWIGEDALAMKKAESLPIGLTPERVLDERYRRFL